jgi:hypothetical protein
LRNGIGTWDEWVPATYLSVGSILVAFGPSIWTLTPNARIPVILIVLGVLSILFAIYVYVRRARAKKSFSKILQDHEDAHQSELGKEIELRDAEAEKFEKEINQLKSQIGQLKKDHEVETKKNEERFHQRLEKQHEAHRSIQNQLKRSYEDHLRRQGDEATKSLVATLQGFSGLAFSLAEKTDGIRSNQSYASRLESARDAILKVVRFNVGPTDVPQGTRTVLFVVNADSTTLSWGMDDGRDGPRSERCFKPGDLTYNCAVRRKPRYVPNVKEIPDSDSQELDYQSFATWPVALGDKLYGILTVDAQSLNAFSDTDLESLRLYAALLSITFSVDPRANSVSITQEG